jgi:hypothetical protein
LDDGENWEALQLTRAEAEDDDEYEHLLEIILSLAVHHKTMALDKEMDKEDKHE